MPNDRERREGDGGCAVYQIGEDSTPTDIPVSVRKASSRSRVRESCDMYEIA